MRSISVDERRARLGRRHGLADRLASAAGATEAMVVLHATDPATVYLSAMARMASPSVEAVSRALYHERSVVRLLAMRRTLFVVPRGLLAVVERSSSDDVAANQRKLLHGLLADSGIEDPDRWLAAATAELVEAMPESGAPARTITRLVPRLATKIVLGSGTKWETVGTATSRVLLVLAAEGLLVRGQPSGRWTGRQHAWHLRRHWLGAEPAGAELGKHEASTALVRRWLTTFGPATFDDLKWWTGWKVSQLRPALADLDLEEVDLHGATGLVLAEDLEPEPPVPEPWAALLPALDPTPMGWKERDWYLGPHRAPLFDRSGNIGPTIWVDGRIVGGWGQRPDGTIVTRLLEDVGSDRLALIDDEVAALSALMGETVVKPSFPTPLQRELAG